MEDCGSGYTISYEEFTQSLGGDVQIEESDIEVDDDEVDPADVLQADIEQIQSEICWNIEKQSKLKVFLENFKEIDPIAA